MWVIGYDSNRVEVPTAFEMLTGSNDLAKSRSLSGWDSAQQDWLFAQRQAVNRVSGALFFCLREGARQLSDSLAAELVAFSVKALEVWMGASRAHRPEDSHLMGTRYFLAGMGIEVFGNWFGDGVKVMWDSSWRTGDEGESIAALARRIWTADYRLDGRGKQHWRQAEWLRRLGRKAHSLAVYRSASTVMDDHVMLALGDQLFAEPEETDRVFTRR